MVRCPACGRHHVKAESCPFCSPMGRTTSRIPRSLVALSSMWLVACYGPGPQGYKESDTNEIVDADGDGYDTLSDCDDTNDAVHPEATEVCDNTVDDDCDGKIDADDTDCPVP